MLIVDGHSTDDTLETACSRRPNVRRVQQVGRGKGAALRSGFAAATGDIIVMLDADGSMDPGEIPAFFGTLLSGADFAKGSRFSQGAGTDDMEFYRRWGNWGFVVLALFFGGRYSDLCYGYNAFWRRILPKLDLTANGFEIETEMNVRALREGLKVAEVPSFEGKRIHGTSNLHTFSDGWRVLKTIFKERFRSSVGNLLLPKSLLGASVSSKSCQPVDSQKERPDAFARRHRHLGHHCYIHRSSWGKLLEAVEIGPIADSSAPRNNSGHRSQPHAAGTGGPISRYHRGGERRGTREFSGARNTGLSIARGEVIAFLDDDAVAVPDWLERLSEGYGDPSVLAVGGALESIWAGGRPAWFPKEFDWVVGGTYAGMPTTTTPVRNLFGGTCLFAARYSMRWGRFVSASVGLRHDPSATRRQSCAYAPASAGRKG